MFGLYRDVMDPIGPKLAEGRDSEIFEHGPGRVLRRARDGRSLEAEARVMAYVGEHGYPVPAVHDAGEGYLVMDRVDGRPMLDLAAAPPFPLRRYGRMLADLHNRLHEIPGPDWLPEAPLAGDRLVHRDLHPLNVLMTVDGPVVIDWANASRGDPAFDVADTWVLFATARPDLKPIERLALPVLRSAFLRAFLGGVDRQAARRAIPAAVEARLLDPNMTADEKARMRKLAEWARRADRP